MGGTFEELLVGPLSLPMRFTYKQRVFNYPRAHAECPHHLLQMSHLFRYGDRVKGVGICKLFLCCGPLELACCTESNSGWRMCMRCSWCSSRQSWPGKTAIRLQGAPRQRCAAFGLGTDGSMVTDTAAASVRAKRMHAPQLAAMPSSCCAWAGRCSAWLVVGEQHQPSQ